MNNIHSLLIVFVSAAVTAIIRFLPFIVFSGRKTPAYIIYLGKVLPCAIMGMLIVYCLKDVSFIKSPFGIPELLCIALVAVLHILFKNTLISMGVGTVAYMLIVQFIV